jgi:glycosyltransferase involved in cell wall biosynthesis
MTIIHIGPPLLPILYSLGGATERRIREIATRQAQTGSRVIVYSAEDKAGTTRFGEVEVRAIECRRTGLARAAEFLIKSLRDARRVKPDVIHFHSLAEGAAFANFFARDLDAKTVLSFDFFEFRRGKRNPFFGWYRRALERFTSLLPVSSYCHRESSRYWSIPEERMQVIYNGVSLQQFRPDPAAALTRRTALGLQDEFVVLYVGRVCEQKGTDLLMEACTRLRKEGRNIRLAIAGPLAQFGNEGDNGFASLLTKHEVVYLGAVDEAVLPSVYNMADVFVMPTRAHEMFGMAAIEAQACGKPVVCSDHGGLPEVINTSSGMLFRPGDIDDLAAKLRTLMDDRALRSRFSQAATANAKRFAWETITNDLYQVYRQA